MKTLKYIGLFISLLLATPSFTQVDRSKAPVPGPAPIIQIGKAEKLILENGLKVIIVENHKLPRVSFRLTFDSDPIFEEKVGTGDMAGNLLRSGTRNMTKSEIDEAVDFLGASLNTFSSGMSGSCLKKHLKSYLDVFTDVLLNPAFPEEEIDKLKTQTLSGIAASKDDPDAISRNVSTSVRYGTKHPYGQIQKEQDVKDITQSDLANYYRKKFQPETGYLVVVGDITKEEFGNDLVKYFLNWKKGRVYQEDLTKPEPPRVTKVAFAHKEDAVQSVISVTYPVNLKPGSQDDIATSVMNNILGGGIFQGRLMQNLREDKAYTYGARSTLSPDEYVGYFSAGASVRNEVTDSAITEILYELRRIISEPVSEKDLQMVKNSMNGSFARSLESPMTVAGFALNIERYNLPKDYYETYLAKLDAVTVEDVKSMAAKYILPDNAWITVVGDQNEVLKNLSKFSKAPVEAYDVYGERTELKRKIKIPEGITADKVINDYLAAIGGKDKSIKIKSLSMKATATMQGMTVEMNQKQLMPGMMLMTASMNGQVMQKIVCDGKNAKETNMMGSKTLEGEALEKTKFSAIPVPEAFYHSKGYKLNLDGMDNLDGEEVYIVSATSPKGEVTKQYFSVKSGLKLQEVITNEGPEGKIKTTVLFANYQAVGGIKFPYSITQKNGPQSMEFIVSEMKVNSKIKKSEFKITG